jgi:hypothetical protein
VLCYSVKVAIPNEGNQSEIAYYLVRAGSEKAALDAILECLPVDWRVAEIHPAAVRPETVDALGLFPGVPRQI